MRKLSMDELNRVTPDAFKAQEKTPLVLVLDNVRSALNVGSAFRTADAFALQKIYLTGITATPPHREILKTALGSTETVVWEYFAEASICIQNLQEEGFQVLAVEQAEGSISLQNFENQSGKMIALIFGNEVTGVSESAMEAADGCLEIPQFGSKHSLNIAVCVGIVVWELFKKMRLTHK